MADNITILNLLSAGRDPEQSIGWRDGRAVRYSEFLPRVRQWRWAASQAASDRLALYINDSIEFAAALFGAWHAGKTVYLPADTLPATCLSLSEATSWFLGEFPPEYKSLFPKLSCLSADAGSFTALPPEFTGLVVFTSGSTGAPQAIPKKLKQLATEVATLEHLFGEPAVDSDVVATVSHQHIYGLLFKVLWALACGRPIHAQSLTYPEELAQTTAAHDCILVSSPAHLKRLPDSTAWTSAGRKVRMVFSSGGPLPSEAVCSTEEILGCTPIEVYGSSETGGIGWRQRKAGSGDAWLLMPGVQARVASDGNALEIRSPHLPDTSWFRTSDRAQIIDGKRLLLEGRIDRIVKIEEKRISLDLIESLLVQSPLVQEARVLVSPSERQRIAAFIVLTSEGCNKLAIVGKHAMNNLFRKHLEVAVERIALPRIWRYLDALPVNAQGKTTQRELMALLDVTRADNRPTLPTKHVIEKDAQRVLFDLVASPDLVYFDGHFPEAPILPGVVQVEWAILFSREQFDLGLPFRALHALKFQRVIRPDTAFSLELLHDPLKRMVSFRYFSPAGMHSSGRLVFGVADV